MRALPFGRPAFLPAGPTLASLAQKPWRMILALFILSVLLRTIVCLVIGVDEFANRLDHDEREYLELSQSLREGTLAFSPKRAPFYPAVLAGAHWLAAGDLRLVHLLLSAIFSASVPLCYLLILRMYGDWQWALAAALLVLVWPPFLYYGASIYSETAALPVFVLALILLPRGPRLGPGDGRAVQYAAAGAVLALCALLRPMYLLFLPFALLILLIEEQQLARAARHGACLLFGWCLLIAPWSTYASLKSGQFILVSANGGETISGGLNPRLSGASPVQLQTSDGRVTWVGPGKWLDPADNGYLREEELNLPYLAMDRLLRKRTLAWILEEPAAAFHLQMRKILYMWGIYPFWNGARQTLAGSLPSLIALFASIAVAVGLPKRRIQLGRFLLLPLFATTVALISWGSWRFRQPGDLGLLVICAWCILASMRGSMMVSTTAAIMRGRKPNRFLPLRLNLPAGSAWLGSSARADGSSAGRGSARRAS